MAQRIDITDPTVHGFYAALVTHPGYYYLYALYFDYPINNAWFRRREYAETVRERLRTIQPLLSMVQPYRKSYALRLFTEREAVGRFPAHLADEAWRQLRQLLERLGPPAGWPHRPPAEPGYRHRPPPGEAPPDAEHGEGSSEAPAAPRRRARRSNPFPKPPIDYEQDV